MSDPLVEAIDAVRENRDMRQLDIVLGKMIMSRKRVSVEPLNEIRDAVYESLIPHFRPDVLSIDIAPMVSTIVERRICDYFRRRYRRARIEQNIASLEELVEVELEPASSLNVADLAEEMTLIDEGVDALEELRNSRDPLDRRAYLLLEGEFTETLTDERMKEIVGKDVTRTNASTLRNRAKQRLRERFQAAGSGRIGA